MKKHLLLILLGIIYLTVYSQDEQIYYKIKFVAYPAFDYPCNDGEGGYFYTQISQTCDVTFTVEDSKGTTTVSPGSINDYTDASIKVKAEGSASVTYNYKGSTFTISADFNASISYTVRLGDKPITTCDEYIFELATEIDDADCYDGKREINIMCRLKIMPFKKLMIGQKLCSGDPIELTAYDGSVEYNHDWYARINEVEWFSLDRDGASETVYIDNIYAKAPPTIIPDDNIPPGPPIIIPVEFVSGDKIEFLVDHSCPEFNFAENPNSDHLAYLSPDEPEYIIPNSPSCTDRLDGSFTIGLINGISPTYFSYSLHEVIHYTVNPVTCGSSIADSNVPIEYPANSGNWYCSNGVSGNYLFTENDSQNEIILDSVSSDGGITGIYEGNWLVYIKLNEPDSYCENYYVRHINPSPQPKLLSTTIPAKDTYTYAKDSFNLPYSGANININFTYNSSATPYNITIGSESEIISDTTYNKELIAGDYKVQIEDSNGCPFEIPDLAEQISGGKFTLTEPGPLNLVDTLKEEVGCHHENVSYTNNGVAQIRVSGGIGPYEITLDGISKSTLDSQDADTAYMQAFNNLDWGFHNFSITPAFGTEEITGTVFIEEPDPLDLQIESIENPVCFPVQDGELKFKANGGSPFYDFFLNGTEKVSDKGESQIDSIGNLIIDTDYTLRIEDVNNCIEEFDFRMDEYANPLAFDTLSSISEICLGGADGSVLLHAYGGHDAIYNVSDFVYYDVIYTEEMIESGTTSYIKYQNLYSDSSYMVRLDDSKGCTVLKEVSVSGYSSPLGFTKKLRIPPNCIGGNDGSLQLQGFGGHAEPYDHTYFSTPAYPDAELSTQSPEIKISDLYGDSIYTVVIDDKAGCSVSDTIYLGEEPNPVQPLLLDSAEERCYEYKDGWIQVSGMSGEKPLDGYRYYLTDDDFFSMNPSDPVDTSMVKSGDEAVFYNLPPGWHNVYISDENDCLNDAIIANRNTYKTEFFVEPRDLIQYEYELHNSSTIGAQDGYVRVSISGGNDKYEYRIMDKQSMVILESGMIGTDTMNLGTLKEGDYTLQFKDTCGCANSSLEWINYDFSILDPADSLRMDVLNVTKPTCYGYSDASVTVKGKDGWGEYQYAVNSVYNGNADGVLTGLSAGSYTICVKDKEGAEYCTMVFIDQPDTLLPLVESITDVQCNGGSDGIVSLNATGGTLPYYYSSDNINWQSNNSLEGFNKGLHTLYIKDEHQCQVSTTAEIDHPDAFSMTYHITNTACGESHGAIECNVIGGTAPYTCSWFLVDNDGEHPVSGNTSTPENLAGGKYKVYLSDAHLCDTSWVFIVNNTDGPVLSIDDIDPVSCSGLVDGAIYYSFNQGLAPYYVELQSGINIISAVTHENTGSYFFSNQEEGYYQIMIRDANACVQSSSELHIEIPNPVEILLDTLIHPVCYAYANGQISVHAEGGNGNYNYLWNNSETNKDINNLVSGSYTVTATDAKGCYSESAYELINPEKLNVDIGDEATICEGQIYPLSAEGFTTYNWTYKGDYISSSEEIEIWSEGIYTLEVTNQNGCFASDTFELFVSNDLLVAEFIMPSEAFENDTVIAIDISWPEPEHVTWSFSEGIIPVSSETYLEEFTFENPGTYTVSLISQKAMCIDSISKQIVVTADTSSAEKSVLGAKTLLRNFKVYPNPNNGKFAVDVELEYNTAITVDLYNLQQNHLVFRQKGNGQSIYHMEYGFTNLQQGVYLVILYVENEKHSERIVIF
jgi:hypothetical protein